jgi:hypothetical protein
MALNETPLEVLRGALKGHVQSSLEVVATLTELAKTEKDPSSGGSCEAVARAEEAGGTETSPRSIQCRASGVHRLNSAVS